MKHIKTYRIWEGKNVLTQEQIDFLNRYTNGTWSVNPDGKVDVNGDFDCDDKEIDSFLWIQFGRVTGSFYCSNNSLSSLKGAPREVGGNFYCHYNSLSSLEGAPQEVTGNFWCSDNELSSLVGAPRKVGRDFWCPDNQLTSLEGAPGEVKGDFWCSNNRITSLKGAPREVGGNFWCNNNPLTSLEGAPRLVGKDFLCSNPSESNTLNLIFEFMQGKPDLPYGAVLLALQDKIPAEDWNRLDKSAIDKMSDKTQKGYKLLGGIGGI